jgi:hypothetical protein
VEDKEDEKKTIKTVILADGTYGQQVVSTAEKTNIEESQLRIDVVESSYTSNIFVSCLINLLYKVRKDSNLFSRLASDVLLIYCAISRIYLLKGT